MELLKSTNWAKLKLLRLWQLGPLLLETVHAIGEQQTLTLKGTKSTATLILISQLTMENLRIRHSRARVAVEALEVIEKLLHWIVLELFDLEQQRRLHGQHVCLISWSH
jgi:hypothetical protein